MAGLCQLGISLSAPVFEILGAKKAIVSGGYLKNSRFWETAAGDWVRSALRGRSLAFFAHPTITTTLAPSVLPRTRGSEHNRRQLGSRAGCARAAAPREVAAAQTIKPHVPHSIPHNDGAHGVLGVKRR
jgi:hypothetical protein